MDSGLTITIIGAGYVGLVTGACLAEIGHTVFCVDTNTEKITLLKHGHVPIYEPGLENLVQRNLKNKRLRFFNKLSTKIQSVDAIFLAVGTPPKPDGSADLSAVIECGRQIGRIISQPTLVVLKSTVPIGTTKLIEQTIGDALLKPVEIEVAANPEFLREGTAVRDFMEPDRIVVGVKSDRARDLLSQIYQPIIQAGHLFITTSPQSAELIKYASNAFLATKISFINELANFCEAAGISIDDVTHGLGTDSRIGPKYLHPGIGYGGSCFPKDVKALLAMGETFGIPFKLLRVVDEVNTKQHLRIVSKLKYHLQTLHGKKIAVWGLAFKANTDDIRQAPSIALITALKQEGAKVTAFDPVVRQISDNTIPIAHSCYDCCNEADALVIATEWQDFFSPDFSELKRRLKQPIIIDGRNIFNPGTMMNQNFIYESIGRSK